MNNTIIGTKKDNLNSIKKMVVMAMFVAITYLMNFVFNFKMGFLSFEAKEAVTVMCAYAYGPVSGIVVAFLSALIESLTASGTGIYGFIMNIAGSAAFVGVAGLIYKYKKNIAGATIGVLLASAVMTAVMIGLNVAITPFYMHRPREIVIGMIVPMLLPFNVVKSIFNGALVLIIRQPIMGAMQTAGVLNQPLSQEKKGVKIAVVVSAAVFAVAAVAYFVIVLGGNVEVFE